MREESAMTARRPRRDKQFDDYQRNEQTICLVIEYVMAEYREPFKLVFPRAIAAFERIGKLSSQGDRTTNRKRMRRAWKALERKRQASHERLVRALAGIPAAGTF